MILIFFEYLVCQERVRFFFFFFTSPHVLCIKCTQLSLDIGHCQTLRYFVRQVQIDKLRLQKVTYHVSVVAKMISKEVGSNDVTIPMPTNNILKFPIVFEA